MQPNACAVRKLKDDMTREGENGACHPSKGENGHKLLPPEILDIIKPALQVGGLSGASGLIVGSFAGLIRSSTPFLFALASGIQWFTLGTTFWASRGAILHIWGKDNITPRDKVSASAIAGGFGGTFGGLLRGPRNIIPGAVMFALFGAAGQALYNSADARASSSFQETAPGRDLKNSWLNSKWSPMKVLSDKEYESMLREKLLKVEVEIALVDESIEALRKQEQEIEAKKTEVEGKGKAENKLEGKIDGEVRIAEGIVEGKRR